MKTNHIHLDFYRELSQSDLNWVDGGPKDWVWSWRLIVSDLTKPILSHDLHPQRVWKTRKEARQNALVVMGGLGLKKYLEHTYYSSEE